jgi:hypothetical protein
MPAARRLVLRALLQYGAATRDTATSLTVIATVLAANSRLVEEVSLADA